MDENEKKKPLEFFTGQMSHLNTEKTFRINPRSVFNYKDLPSCVYRIGHYLTDHPYISPAIFFKELSFHESLQLYQMVNVISSEQSGNFVADTPQKRYMLDLSRVALMKSTELLCYGTGENEIPVDTFIQKIITLGAMASVHFMHLSGSLTANYDKFDINASNFDDFILPPSSEDKGGVEDA